MENERRITMLEDDLRESQRYNRELCTNIGAIALSMAKSETLQKANNDLLIEQKKAVEVINKRSIDTERLAQDLQRVQGEQNDEMTVMKADVTAIKEAPIQENKKLRWLVISLIVTTVILNGLGFLFKFIGLIE